MNPHDSDKVASLIFITGVPFLERRSLYQDSALGPYPKQGWRNRSCAIKQSWKSRPPYSRPKRIPRSYPSLKITPFSRILGEKKPFFNRNRWFWGPVKHPFLKQNAQLSSLYEIKYPFCESEINCIKHFFSAYIVFFSMSKLERVLNTRPRPNVWKPGWKQADTCKIFTLFQNFTDLCLKSCPFSWFREFALIFEKLLLSSRKCTGYERGIRFDAYVCVKRNIHAVLLWYINSLPPGGCGSNLRM